MRIVVTGSTGFLGSRIADYYRDKYEVFTPTHSEMDITDKEAVKRYLEGVKPDIVIHCAAVSDVGTCDKEPERTWKINVNGSENIAEISRITGAKCIMCSSDQVYFGSEVKTPHLENEPLEPHNEYGRQKLVMEEKCLEKNPDSVMLRLSWMYDTERKHAQEHDNFMRKLLEDMRNNNQLSFPVYDKRGITNVRQVVENLEKVFELPGGVYNFGSYNDKNTYETMREVFDKTGCYDLSFLHENTSAFADNHRNISMNVDKIKRMGIIFSGTADGIAEVLKGTK